ncbi:hypothetical protein AXF42_Ash010126 [Apostasia shenzhenica]|uniref:Uncharacterized protein n=1 Tax=Apostasia shenzhenica TaxID=1088818 RepID=A0A2I0A9L5_9ASPA|nr:hypothetical protein AXF42_Ash010126 [Apostasia shenzhenica]
MWLRPKQEGRDPEDRLEHSQQKLSRPEFLTLSRQAQVQRRFPTSCDAGLHHRRNLFDPQR